MLRNFGYERLDIVENGKLAVEKVKEGNVDIVLMDVMVGVSSVCDMLIQRCLKWEESKQQPLSGN